MGNARARARRGVRRDATHTRRDRETDVCAGRSVTRCGSWITLPVSISSGPSERLHTSLPPARGRAPSAGCYPLTRAAAAVDPPHASSRHSAAYHPSRVAAAAVVHEQHGLGLEDLGLVHARDQRLETWGCRLGAWGCGSGYLGSQRRTRRRLLLLLLPLIGAPAILLLLLLWHHARRTS